MLVKGIVAAVIAALVIGCCAVDAFAAQDATDEWASVASSYNFAATPPSTFATFEDAYTGGCPCNFRTDFDAILAAVASLMGTTVPPYSGDDQFSASLQNWPDA